MNTTIKFELTIDQVNIILESLYRMPFGQVSILINELQKQAHEQIQTSNQTVSSMPMIDTNS
jgi:hypothetical protein